MNKKLLLLSAVLLAAVAVSGGCDTTQRGYSRAGGALTLFFTEGDDYVIYRGLYDFMLTKGQPRAFAVVLRPTVVPMDEHEAWSSGFSSSISDRCSQHSAWYSDGLRIGFEYTAAKGYYDLSLNGQTVSLEKDFVYFMDGTTILRKVSYAELGLVFPTRNDEYCEKFKQMIEPAIRAYVETNSEEIFGVELTKEQEEPQV